MPGIKSDISNKKYNVSAPLREFEVSDESNEESQEFGSPTSLAELNELRAFRAQQLMKQKESGRERFNFSNNSDSAEELLEMERQIQAAREAKQNPNKTRLSEAAKRRIELLTGISKNTRSTEIDGNVYTLRSLRNKEVREALLASVPYDGTFEFSMETRRHLLARSLTQVGGNDLEMILGDNSLEARLEFIDLLDERVSTKLHKEYLELLEEINEKYGLKNEQQTKEVIEDLKK